MNTPQDIGPAFPSQNGCSFDSGMSLRDWFAGMALQGQVSTDQGFHAESDKIAQWSYQLADSMLAARERKEDA